MNHPQQRREAPGTPAGGRFAAQSGSHGEIELDDTADRQLWSMINHNSRRNPRDEATARAELAAAGVTDEEMRRVTGAGLRHLPGCDNVDSLLRKYQADALSISGVMAELYGTDSPEHHRGSAHPPTS